MTPFHFFHDFRSSVPSIADGRGSSTDFGFFPFFGRCPPTSVTSLEGYGSRVFYFKTSLALSRNFLKFPIYLRPTRVNFSTASSTTLPHPEEGAALLRGRLSPSFSVFPFRPGNLGLFGALLQPPAPEMQEIRPRFFCDFIFSKFPRIY